VHQRNALSSHRANGCSAVASPHASLCAQANRSATMLCWSNSTAVCAGRQEARGNAARRQRCEAEDATLAVLTNFGTWPNERSSVMIRSCDAAEDLSYACDPSLSHNIVISSADHRGTARSMQRQHRLSAPLILWHQSPLYASRNVAVRPVGFLTSHVEFICLFQPRLGTVCTRNCF